MNQNVIDRKEISDLLPAIQLLSGDTSVSIDGSKVEILHELCMRFIFNRAIPNQSNKDDWKKDILKNVAELQDADQRDFHTEFLDIILDDPYQTFKGIKEKYPAWLSEYILYLWDTSGMLNEEIFYKENDIEQKEESTIIEAGTEEYVRFLISKR